MTDIHSRCEKCGANLQPEQRFFDGAMYISYAFSVAWVISVFVSLPSFIDKPELWTYFATSGIIPVVLLPTMLYYSKISYLYTLGKFQKKAIGLYSSDISAKCTLD